MFGTRSYCGLRPPLPPARQPRAGRGRVLHDGRLENVTRAAVQNVPRTWPGSYWGGTRLPHAMNPVRTKTQHARINSSGPSADPTVQVTLQVTLTTSLDAAQSARAPAYVSKRPFEPPGSRSRSLHVHTAAPTPHDLSPHTSPPRNFDTDGHTGHATGYPTNRRARRQNRAKTVLTAKIQRRFDISRMRSSTSRTDLCLCGFGAGASFFAPRRHHGRHQLQS
jgi:hypothetical protein